MIFYNDVKTKKTDVSSNYIYNIFIFIIIFIFIQKNTLLNDILIIAFDVPCDRILFIIKTDGHTKAIA